MITDKTSLNLIKIIGFCIFCTYVIFIGQVTIKSIIYFNIKDIYSTIFFIFTQVIFIRVITLYSFWFLKIIIKVTRINKIIYYLIKQMPIECYLKSQIDFSKSWTLNHEEFDILKIFSFNMSLIKIGNRYYYFYYDNTWIKIKDNEEVILRTVRKSNILFYIGE
jgi:hypothetical protein